MAGAMAATLSSQPVSARVLNSPRTHNRVRLDKVCNIWLRVGAEHAPAFADLAPVAEGRFITGTAGTLPHPQLQLNDLLLSGIRDRDKPGAEVARPRPGQELDGAADGFEVGLVRARIKLAAEVVGDGRCPVDVINSTQSRVGVVRHEVHPGNLRAEKRVGHRIAARERVGHGNCELAHPTRTGLLGHQETLPQPDPGCGIGVRRLTSPSAGGTIVIVPTIISAKEALNEIFILGRIPQI